MELAIKNGFLSCSISVCALSVSSPPPLTAAGCYPFGKYLPEKCPLADFVLNATMALTGTVKKFI